MNRTRETWQSNGYTDAQDKRVIMLGSDTEMCEICNVGNVKNHGQNEQHEYRAAICTDYVLYYNLY
jgi:hypothetical protein